MGDEKMVEGPSPFVKIPPRHYVIVYDPVIDPHRRPYKHQFGQEEYRFDEVDPFPLYPGESCSDVLSLLVVEEGKALHLRALVDGKDRSGTFRAAGDEWILPGPLTYYPCAAEEIFSAGGEITCQNLLPGEAFHLTAIRNFTDRDGVERKAGEVWMYSKPGSFFLDLAEKVVSRVKAVVLEPNTGIYVKALKTFVDSKGKKRRVGDTWLITEEETESFLAPPEVQVSERTKAVVLSLSQYCYLKNPIDQETMKPRIGIMVLKEGPDVFYILPGEEITPIYEQYHLGAEDALLLVAKEDFEDTTSDPPVFRTAGYQWLFTGPANYRPPVQVDVADTRSAIPLSETEGIYVKDWSTGKIRIEKGVQSYMIKAHECLWEKPIATETLELIRNGGGVGASDIRKLQYFSDNALPASTVIDPTRVISFRAPGGTAVQVVDMKSRETRVVFGPDLVLLEPFEEFTILRYSAGKPKRKGALVSLCLLLGPDFITDIFEVETLDHARLSIKLASNVHFDFDRNDPVEVNKLFSVKDFIGDCANMVASRVRSLVAHTPFDQFHRNSAKMIEEAIFGPNKEEYRFSANNLVVANVDIQNVKVVDDKARNSLLRSVQIAIDTTSKKMEMASIHEANMLEKQAEGKIKIEKFQNEAQAEEIRQSLVAAKVENEIIAKVGNVCATARAEAEVSYIEGETLVARAQARELALSKINEKEDLVLEKQRKLQMDFRKREIELELEREASLSELEASRFSSAVAALGPSTVQAISEAEQNSKIKLLNSLGLEGMLVSSGRNPMNLERTANGMIGFL
eukprot:CAMPEP_0201488730 /NCGR_PEP_ID=MMETSP0151_2-20130828/19345_1 /ASSEMBLY_ACC=CAM_ASM_000257 /TAXON_ID=200890 /ORGANISM="Paramoeba atlantica, Strain 621/1 / CCAP 1560/9" /LENGTH=798 /DNA_ID=CAMNT_0047874083 /DNA_START=168 /DNA_END=2564 /DNA_ORIENTATION=-